MHNTSCDTYKYHDFFESILFIVVFARQLPSVITHLKIRVLAFDFQSSCIVDPGQYI